MDATVSGPRIKNPCASSHSSRCTDNTGSLTYLATQELQDSVHFFLFFFFSAFLAAHTWKFLSQGAKVNKQASGTGNKATLQERKGSRDQGLWSLFWHKGEPESTRSEWQVPLHIFNEIESGCLGTLALTTLTKHSEEEGSEFAVFCCCCFGLVFGHGHSGTTLDP